MRTPRQLEAMRASIARIVALLKCFASADGVVISADVKARIVAERRTSSRMLARDLIDMISKVQRQRSTAFITLCKCDGAAAQICIVEALRQFGAAHAGNSAMWDATDCDVNAIFFPCRVERSSLKHDSALTMLRSLISPSGATLEVTSTSANEASVAPPPPPSSETLRFVPWKRRTAGGCVSTDIFAFLARYLAHGHTAMVAKREELTEAMREFGGAPGSVWDVAAGKRIAAPSEPRFFHDVDPRWLSPHGAVMLPIDIVMTLKVAVATKGYAAPTLRVRDAPDGTTRVVSLEATSVAAHAGVEHGDEIVRVGRMSMQWKFPGALAPCPTIEWLSTPAGAGGSSFVAARLAELHSTGELTHLHLRRRARPQFIRPAPRPLRPASASIAAEQMSLVRLRAEDAVRVALAVALAAAAAASNAATVAARDDVPNARAAHTVRLAIEEHLAANAHRAAEDRGWKGAALRQVQAWRADEAKSTAATSGRGVSALTPPPWWTAAALSGGEPELAKRRREWIALGPLDRLRLRLRYTSAVDEIVRSSRCPLDAVPLPAAEVSTRAAEKRKRAAESASSTDPRLAVRQARIKRFESWVVDAPLVSRQTAAAQTCVAAVRARACTRVIAAPAPAVYAPPVLCSDGHRRLSSAAASSAVLPVYGSTSASILL